ncbi:unnamed protein product [Pleuronectes platessa]|uniref:MBD domain-containing protein n=1 Tax=Pleuronectes platessa TaxID=8262 RepID=A0A9N7VQQ8_PLEPL|nr:unnamed protein product [Pleuronectes platessa]
MNLPLVELSSDQFGSAVVSSGDKRILTRLVPVLTRGTFNPTSVRKLRRREGAEPLFCQRNVRNVPAAPAAGHRLSGAAPPGIGHRGRGSIVPMERKRTDCPALPPGWKKEEVTRKSGLSAGKSDIYYYSPTGKKFRSKPQLSRYLATR